GDTIGKYRLVNRLGRGGMGEVWLAKASGYGGFQKAVVVKTLLPELASDPLFVDLLAREAKTCATLSHPNLIEVFDFTEHDGMYLLAMEHVVGQPLNGIMRAAHERGWGIPAWFALRIAWDCCCGLQYAHEQGVIHCDLSPSNVMVTYTGATKVLDFGVAHASAQGPRSDRLKGKFSYMAPERIKTRATDRRTDIYALGAMLYLLFTGQLPFTGETDAELLYKITNDKLVPPSTLVEIDPRIEAVVIRAMHPDPTRRYQKVVEVLEALAPCLDGQLGTYGQQHVAAFVNTLFGKDVVVAPLVARANGAVAPIGPSEVDLAEIEIDLDSEPHAIPSAVSADATARLVARLPTAPPIPPIPAIPPIPPPPARAPLVSAQLAPLHKDKPLISAFAQSSTPQEPKSSVQSLFDERPSTVSTIAGLFATGTREDVRHVDAAEPAEPAPVVMPEPDPRERTRSLFGEYTAARPAKETAWPWPVSRKS
ncbi:MAG TPA: serine/threonine-protein kinase, partial [Kofleriaceae bacterium]|nr:serine/threonine-protein kinase [Kofleriaceae bacterium]